MKEVQRILVVRLDARLGNLVFCLPFVSALKNRFPQSEVSFLVSGRFADLLNNVEGVEVLTFDKKRALNPVYLLGLISHLRAKRFDWCFDLASPESPSFTNSLLSALSGARLRVGYRSKYAEVCDNLLFEPEKGAALWQLFFQLLEKTSPGKEAYERILTLTSEEERVATTFYGRGRAPKVGIFLGGRGEKKWESDNWSKVAQALAGLGCRIFLFYGPDEKPPGTPKTDAITNVAPRPTREFATLLSGLDLLLAVDCGPLHLASALDVPVVGLYFASDPVRFAPMGKRKVLICESKTALTPERVGRTAMEFLEALMGEKMSRPRPVVAEPI